MTGWNDRRRRYSGTALLTVPSVLSYVALVHDSDAIFDFFSWYGSVHAVKGTHVRTR